MTETAVTLTKYWERLNKDEMDFLLHVLKTRDPNRSSLHHGLLPFISAEEAYKAAAGYVLPSQYQTPEGMLLLQGLLAKLKAHRPLENDYRDKAFAGKHWKRFE